MADRLSVSLRSITHSYYIYKSFTYYIWNSAFRLLTEYHSFLCNNKAVANANVMYIYLSVSLRSITHSYEPLQKISFKLNSRKLSVSLRSITHSYV